MTNPTPTMVTVNGLTMTTDMFARVTASLRGLFPDLAQLSDDGLIQAVMLRYIKDWLSRWEGSQANPMSVDVAVDQLRTQYQSNTQAAQTKALTDAEGITPTVTT